MVDMYELCGITENDLRKLFEKHSTIASVAKHLGVSRKTVGKYARSLGIAVVAHRPKQKTRPQMANGYGPIAAWLKANPGKKLPASTKKAAEIIGVKPADLYAFLGYKKKRFERYLREKPFVGSLNRVVYDLQGRAVYLKKVREAKIEFDPKLFKVNMTLTLGDMCTARVELSLKAFENLFILQKSQDNPVDPLS